MSGIERIAAERRRQVDVEGFSPEHDDYYQSGTLAKAAASYAIEASSWRVRRIGLHWPASRHPYWWKPGAHEGDEITDALRVRMLEKAGALIAAEIDRLERREAKKP